MKFKAITDFSGYTGDALWPDAQVIHDDMTKAGKTFDKPTVDMNDLQTSIDTFKQALLNKASGAKADTLAFNVARVDLEDKLRDLGGYVNSVAKGDETILISSGFPYYPTTRTKDFSPPAAPTDPTIRQGDMSGTALLRYRPARRPSTNEVQTCTGDPSVDANWKSVGYFNGGRAVINNITPGTTIWVRVRTIGLNSVMGAWSEPVKIMVV